MVDFAEIREWTIDEAKTEILAAWATLEINEPLHFGEGSLPSLLLEASALMINKLSRMSVASRVLTLGELATGEALTLWSSSVYGHERYPATAARHRIGLTCAAGSGPHTFDIGSAVVASDSMTYRLVVPDGTMTFPFVLSGGEVVYPEFEAEQPGVIGNQSVIGAINRMVTTYIGVTCANVNVGGGRSETLLGSDSETDEQLRERNRTWWATLNPLTMTRDSVIYYARQARSTVRRVQVLDQNPHGEYTFDVILGGETGPATASDVTAVETALGNRLLAPFRDRMDVKAAIAHPFSLVGRVYYYSGFSEPMVQAAINISLATLGSSDIDLPIGGQTFEGYGDHMVLRAQFEKAIEAAQIGGQPCVKLATLSSPDVSTAIAIDDMPTIQITYDASHLVLTPVLE
jgi:hypothetical protein